jgi:hypothetical protein
MSIFAIQGFTIHYASLERRVVDRKTLASEDDVYLDI